MIDQVGGDHYTRLKVQPMEFAEKRGLSYAEGSVLKYLTRTKGEDDGHKAASILKYLSDRRWFNWPRFGTRPMRRYCAANNIDESTTKVLCEMYLRRYWSAHFYLTCKLNTKDYEHTTRRPPTVANRLAIR